MDSIIYDYLIKNEYQIIDYHDDIENQIFLDCLLILSTNKFIIDYNTLLEYCINIIKQNNSAVNNNNNKRNLNLEDGDHDLFYGLNNNQFNILHKIIKSLGTINSNDSSSSSRSVNQHSNNTSNNNSKFDYSILIIIENNLKLYQQTRNNNNSGLSSKRIKLNNNNNSLIISSHSSNRSGINNSSINEIDYNYLLFKKVWGNLTIRNEIKLHMRLFNLHNQAAFLYKRLRNYKYRSYITNLKLYSNDDEDLFIDNEDYEFQYEHEDEDELITPADEEFTSEHCKYISSSVKSLELLGYKQINENSIPSSVTSLSLGQGLNQKLTKNLFIGGADNIIELDLGNSFNKSLSCGPNDNGESWLPRNLKSLTLGSRFQQSIYPGQLPNSLTSLKLDKNYYKGTIIPNSIPESVTTLDYEFDSMDNIGLLNTISIPMCTTNLTFDDSFDQAIEPGFIPHNVTSLTFGFNFNKPIKPNSLPHSLRSIEFGYCFNQPLDRYTFPPNLISLIFGDHFNQHVATDFGSIFPSSITQLELGKQFNQPINNITFGSLGSLEDLTLGIQTHEIENASLPNSIKTLDLKYYQHNLPNQLPKSLTHLSYTIQYSINPLDNTTLPNSLTSLFINGLIDQANIPLPIPPNLKSITLKMKNKKSDDLSLINFPASLESIYVKYNSYPLFNNIPLEFLLKYIKIYD